MSLAEGRHLTNREHAELVDLFEAPPGRIRRIRQEAAADCERARRELAVLGRGNSTRHRAVRRQLRRANFLFRCCDILLETPEP